MAKAFALVLDGRVVNVWRGVPSSAKAADVSPLNAAALVECPADAEQGWLYDPVGRTVAAPPVVTPSVRKQRRTEYFLVLRREDGDDEITVLGDVIDVALAQIEAIRQATGTPASAQWTDLIGKVAGVKAKLPKSGG